MTQVLIGAINNFLIHKRLKEIKLKFSKSYHKFPHKKNLSRPTCKSIFDKSAIKLEKSLSFRCESTYKKIFVVYFAKYI